MPHKITLVTDCGCCIPCSSPDFFNDGNPCVDTSTCTFYAIDDIVTLVCEGCESGFADYVVTNIECLGDTCRYTLEFVECVPV